MDQYMRLISLLCQHLRHILMRARFKEIPYSANPWKYPRVVKICLTLLTDNISKKMTWPKYWLGIMSKFCREKNIVTSLRHTVTSTDQPSPQSVFLRNWVQCRTTQRNYWLHQATTYEFKHLRSTLRGRGKHKEIKLTQTGVMCPSLGNILVRFLSVKEVFIFLTTHRFRKENCMQDPARLQTLAYLTDVLRINDLNLPVLGSNANVFNVQERTEPFM
jgi:hypothetical protein